LRLFALVGEAMALEMALDVLTFAIVCLWRARKRLRVCHDTGMVSTGQ
jgi:hypothetical protein